MSNLNRNQKILVFGGGNPAIYPPELFFTVGDHESSNYGYDNGKSLSWYTAEFWQGLLDKCTYEKLKFKAVIFDRGSESWFITNRKVKNQMQQNISDYETIHKNQVLDIKKQALDTIINLITFIISSFLIEDGVILIEMVNNIRQFNLLKKNDLSYKNNIKNENKRIDFYELKMKLYTDLNKLGAFHFKEDKSVYCILSVQKKDINETLLKSNIVGLYEFKEFKNLKKIHINPNGQNGMWNEISPNFPPVYEKNQIEFCINRIIFV